MAASSSRTLLLGYPPPPTTTTTLVPRPTVAELQRWVRSWELPISISALFRMARREAITKRPVRVESSGTVLYQVTVLPTGLRAWKKQGAKVKPRCTQNKRRSQQKQNKEKTKEKETQVGSVRSCVILINRTQSDTSRLTTLQTSVDSKEGQVQPPYPITAFFFSFLSGKRTTPTAHSHPPDTESTAVLVYAERLRRSGNSAVFVSH